MWARSVLLAILLQSHGAVASNYTYVLYDSAIGNFNKTIQSWSYGDIKLKVAAPTGLPSGNPYAISVGVGYSTQLTMHGSLVFEYGDMLELSFYVYNSGATKGAKLQLMKGDASTGAGQAVVLDPAAAGQWQAVTVPFKAFFNGTEPSASQQLNGLDIGIPPGDNDTTGAAMLLADMHLVARVPSADAATVTVTKGKGGRQVSPRLFGVNWGLSPFEQESEQKWQTSYTTNRWGGNAVTRYSWESDIQNRAFDWYFEDIPNTVQNTSALPFNSSSDLFVTSTLNAKALPVLTIPTIGWAPQLERNRRCGFSVAKYGAQQSSDQGTDCGNGMKTDGSAITGNDPTDTSRKVGPDNAVAWLDHLANVFGKSAVSDDMLYILDNEPNYWSGTHRDVHPEELKYDELWNYTVAYGEALTTAYPGVKLMGPDIAGFPNLFTRTCGDDCKAHGSVPIIEWFIKQLGDYEKQNNKQLLEYLDIHCYPEGDNWQTGDAADITMRMRETRELWDESFFAETWFTMSMGYLRRLRTLADQHAPWLKMSCTEFSYGNEWDVVDSVLTLNALAIYAREGVDLATRWSVPATGSITSYAYAFLNDYDQAGGSISGLSYINSESTESLLGTHAFGSADGTPSVFLLIGKHAEGNLVANVNLGVSAAAVDLYRLDKEHASPGKPEALAAGSTVSVTMPPTSAALLVIRKPDYVEVAV